MEAITPNFIISFVGIKMADNEPLYLVLKALKMKMYRAVEAKRKHEYCVKYFDRIATHNQREIAKTDIIIRLNRLQKQELFATFWSLQ